MFVVAGVTGNVGRVVATELLEKKQPVKVIVRDAAKGAEWSKRGAEVAVGSLDDAAFLTTALKNAQGFFALIPPTMTAPDFLAYQRKIADAIAQAVKAAKVPHVAILSSIGAELDKGNGPVRGLNYLERALRETGTHLSAIRPGGFQENYELMIPALQMGVFPNFMASADYPMPMIATRDIGMLAAQQLLARPNKSEVIDIHGPAYSVRQLVEKISNVLGKKINIVDVPASQHVPSMLQAGMPKDLAELYAEMYAAFASGTLQPKGDRFVQGTTTIDETLKTLPGKVAPGLKSNPFVWVEIPTRDLAKAQPFYEHVFQFKLTLNEMGTEKMGMFPMAMGVPGSPGTLVQGPNCEPGSKGTVVYFTTDDIDRALERVKERGGKVVATKTSIGQHGFYGLFEDLDGNRVGLHSMS